MLPTKGYFQDIECPFFDTTCGRPYCHFRHKKRPNESDDNVQLMVNNVIPTYKPTPKSELAHIHSRSHIPISYVPDLAFKRERAPRPRKIERPIYNPTPLSILSSAKKPLLQDHENQEVIKDIQENIASNVYDPSKSEINFEDLCENLSNEFELIDDIINDSQDEPQSVLNDNLAQIDSAIKKEQIQLNLLQGEVSTDKTHLLEEDDAVLKAKDTSQLIVRNTETHKSNIKSTAKCESDSKDKLSTKDKSDKEKDPKKQENSSKSHSKSSDRSRDKKKEKISSNDKNDIHSGHESKRKSKELIDSLKEKSTPAKINTSSEKPKSEKSSHSKSKKTKSRRKSRSSSKEKHHSKHKSERSHSRSTSKHKYRDRKRSKANEKNSKSITDKEKISKRTSAKQDKKTIQYSNSSSSDNEKTTAEDSYPIPSDIELDLEDEDETMRECYKIFNEFKPETKEQSKSEETERKESFDEANAFQGKKRTAHAGAENQATISKSILPPKSVLLPGQMLVNRYKIAKMTQANNEQEHILNEVKSLTQQPVKRPPTSLLEAARLHKIRRLQKTEEKEKSSTMYLVDNILNGVHNPSSNVKVQPKKIAAVSNVALIEKAKERISLIKKQRSLNVKTIAQTQKAGGRVAHVPEYSLSDIPDVLQAQKSKLPVNVRTRLLTMIADECFKLYSSKEDAYNRALNEEFACYEKCKALATYRNSAMLAVNRLRKEIQDRNSKGLGLLLSGENPLQKKELDFQGTTFYEHIKKWALTEEELDIHGYPRESGKKGEAIINNRVNVDYSLVDDNQRRCSRCGKVYQVDDDGWPLFDEACMYHPLKKRTIRGEQIFLCCKSNDDMGCLTSDNHVFDGLQKHLLEGYQTTLPPENDKDNRSRQVYALDCEMCYTTKGLELTRVTIIDVDCKTVYESLVKPLNPIIDYNTNFSGITKEQMDRTSTSILQVQANILHLCNSKTILVGHSLESDLKALKIIHGNVVDTSVLFPHKMGLPHKRALRTLASEYLKKIIQNDVAGHDSAEDAVACMELIKWKLKEDLKVKIK